MPLSVDIKINGQHITTLRIGRTETFKGEDKVHQYLVVEKADNWSDGVPFRHKYSDGAVTCVRKALEAFEAQG